MLGGVYILAIQSASDPSNATPRWLGAGVVLRWIDRPNSTVAGSTREWAHGAQAIVTGDPHTSRYAEQHYHLARPVSFPSADGSEGELSRVLLD